MASRVLGRSTIIRVQTWDIDAVPPSRVEPILGVAWPRLTGRSVRGRTVVVSVGPTEWLVVAAPLDGDSLVKGLSDELRGSSFRATDVSAALARIQIEGVHARALLSKACSVDVHPRAFCAGQAICTRFAGMPVVVHHNQAEVFECIVASSYQDYLISWLEDAALELQ